jgi:hypothetical protein
MAKDCAPRVFPESLTRISLECESRNLPFTFDVEKACGFQLTTTYEAPMPTDTAEAAGDCDVSKLSSSMCSVALLDRYQDYVGGVWMCLATGTNTYV